MKKLCFRSDGQFQIMQVSDAQDMHFVRKTMLYMLNQAYEKEKPDLVVFTGDNILGNHLCDRRFGSGRSSLSHEEELGRMKKALDAILRPLEEREIPFTMIFGNHDDMNQISKEEQLEIYRSYSNFVYGESGLTGDHVLPIYSSDGERPICALWLFDSSRYDAEKDICEQSIRPGSVSWFSKTADKFREENDGKDLPGYAFIHIPLPIMQKLLLEENPAEGDTVHLNPEKAAGIINESPSIVSTDSGLFDALRAHGVSAILFGHDHQNNFIGEIDGVKLVQTSCASLRCYGNKDLRGVRILKLNEENAKDFQTKFLSYRDLCGDGFLSSLRYFWDADEYEEEKAALIAAGVLLLSVTLKGTHFVLERKKKKKNRSK